MILKSYELKKNTKDLIKNNFFLIYGENEGLKKDIKEIILSNLKNEEKNIEILIFYEKEIIDNKENFYNSIYSGSLFSNRKLIVLHNGTDKILNQIEDITTKHPDNITLIIFSDILEKKSKLRSLFEKEKNTICIPCYLDNNKDLEIIATIEFKKNNISISRESINFIVDAANCDRNNLKNEIEKIKSFSMNKKKIEIDEIKSIVNFTGDYKSDSLVNECLCGNISEYKKILSELYLNTINQVFLLRILSNKIQRLLNMKKNEKKYNNLESLLSASRPPIFWKEKPVVKKQLTIWNLRDLKNTISEINNTELLCKRNPQSSKVIFFNFFTKLCKKASSFS
tara:strand:+ start:2391 stop:3410 length:1020 start_codon:yes stop_codon:yes gene_type:complete